ncbi:HAD family hydrolase [Romboutsia maritimum]|uniref:HAD family hydrolase n=1 Tax=Romboutsia maritimum TaxID=2020948 RepID=A0A371IS98_9FIRM|nr:cation-translocating P-type ATPase [Romboutsia maritimum]RDY23347.1 HAD family hydrolase [Romboutsia maritimum]
MGKDKKEKINIKRFNPNPQKGLLKEQVQDRIKEGLCNINIDKPSKTIGEIITSNVFTFFNFLNFALATLIILVGSYRNALFMGVVISNLIIGIVQEIRAKKTIDKLSLLSASYANVIRDSSKKQVNLDEVVLDDIIILKSGDQVCVDSIIVSGEVEVNESLLTGEPDAILKKLDETLLSGSFIISGECRVRTEKVGLDCYASKITQNAKKKKRVNSQIMNSLDKIIKVIAVIIIPLGMILFIKQFYILNSRFEISLVTTVAAVIGMIPEGLYLLTSIALAVSVVRLGKSKTLVQELYCIETLARVDMICIDKTGTITEGKMKVKDIASLNNSNYDENKISKIISEFTQALNDDNSTFNALKEHFKEESKWNVSKKVPFSSVRKWSGVSFNEQGTYIIGAPEFVLNSSYEKIKSQVEEYSLKGDRVLLLVKYNGELNTDIIDKDVEIISLIILEDKIRDNVNETFEFFDKQGVNIKVISGDNPVTVCEIAKRAGISDADKYLDVSSITSKDKIQEIIKNYTIFGRVTPNQKQEIIKEFQNIGYTVAMIGDGVNDVLALKDADCSIAMASGSDAACHISQLVLMDSNFKYMPKVVMEGRRVINNIQRTASLFLVKTIYSLLLSILVLFFKNPYPFVPIQLTLISGLTIGIPSFFFALESNTNIVKGNFIKNVIGNALIGAITIVINIVGIMSISNRMNLSTSDISTLATILTGYTGFLILFRISKPFNYKRIILIGSMIILFLISIIFLGKVFMIHHVSIREILLLLVFIILTYPLMLVITWIIRKIAFVIDKRIIIK